MKRSIILATAVILLGALIGGFAYFQFVVKPEMIRGMIAGTRPPPATVTAEPARTESWDTRLPAIGTFAAMQGVEIAPQVGGVVRTILFESGQEVEAGAVLVRLDTAVEQADLVSDQAQLKNAALELDRQRELFARGNASKTTLDAAIARRDTAAAAVERTRAVIAQKSIAAPFAGRLGIRQVHLGQYVSPGTMLVTLQRLDPIFVDFPIPETHIAVLRTGQPVEVQVDAYPNQVFRGRVASLDARVNPETRNVLVRAEIANPDRRLLPGMFANVGVVAGGPQQVVTLPRTAVTYSLYGDSVYVAVTGAAPADGGEPPVTAERRFVRVGETRGDRLAIAEGVRPGEQIVTSGQIKLQSGAQIRIDNRAALAVPATRPRE